MGEPLRLLIVDDSALMRRVLRSIFESDPGIRVVGEAANGQEALQCVAALRPDVITMDVRMPLMDGVATTEHVMAYHPTPILVLTASLSSYDVDITFRMLGAGALDVMEKPSLNSPEAIARARRDLIRRVKLLSRVKVVTHLRGRRRSVAPEEAPAHIPSAAPLPSKAAGRPAMALSTPAPTVGYPIIVIGASTGGPRVVRQILSGLSHSFRAAVIVVQHIAEGFSSGMVEWLNATSTIPVALAHQGDSLLSCRVLVAPDRANLLITSEQKVHLSNKPLLLQLPSVDVTMQAVAEVYKARSLGVLLTGMGRDGAIGMKSIKRAGGYTIAQDEASCTIFGMPRAAIELNAADEVLPPDKIIEALYRRVNL